MMSFLVVLFSILFCNPVTPYQSVPHDCNFRFEGELCCRWVLTMEPEMEQESRVTYSEEYCLEASSMCEWTFNGGGVIDSFFLEIEKEEESGCGEGLDKYLEEEDDIIDEEEAFIQFCIEGNGWSREKCREDLERKKREY